MKGMNNVTKDEILLSIMCETYHEKELARKEKDKEVKKNSHDEKKKKDKDENIKKTSDEDDSST